MSRTFFRVHRISQQRKTLKSFTDCFTGLGFRVLHPVVIERLLLPMFVVMRSNNLLLVLSDPEEVIEEVKLSPSACFEEDDFCSIKLPHRLRLPRGYEGELRVVSAEENEDLCGLNLYDFHDGRDKVS